MDYFLRPWLLCGAFCLNCASQAQDLKRVVTHRVVRRSRCPSRKQPEFFAWSRILENSRSPMESFLHRTPKLVIPVQTGQFLMKILSKQRIVAVYHDFN